MIPRSIFIFGGTYGIDAKPSGVINKLSNTLKSREVTYTINGKVHYTDSDLEPSPLIDYGFSTNFISAKDFISREEPDLIIWMPDINMVF